VHYSGYHLNGVFVLGAVHQSVPICIALSMYRWEIRLDWTLVESRNILYSHLTSAPQNVVTQPLLD